MITSKQRAALRSMANSIETILQVGKGGVGEALVRQTEDALRARELIKMRVLETAPLSAREAAQKLAAAADADIVQVIGSRFVLYRKNEDSPRIELP